MQMNATRKESSRQAQLSPPGSIQNARNRVKIICSLTNGSHWWSKLVKKTPHPQPFSPNKFGREGSKIYYSLSVPWVRTQGYRMPLLRNCGYVLSSLLIGDLGFANMLTAFRFQMMKNPIQSQPAASARDRIRIHLNRRMRNRFVDGLQLQPSQHGCIDVRAEVEKNARSSHTSIENSASTTGI